MSDRTQHERLSGPGYPTGSRHPDIPHSGHCRLRAPWEPDATAGRDGEPAACFQHLVDPVTLVTVHQPQQVLAVLALLEALGLAAHVVSGDEAHVERDLLRTGHL